MYSFCFFIAVCMPSSSSSSSTQSSSLFTYTSSTVLSMWCLGMWHLRRVLRVACVLSPPRECVSVCVRAHCTFTCTLAQDCIQLSLLHAAVLTVCCVRSCTMMMLCGLRRRRLGHWAPAWMHVSLCRFNVALHVRT